MGMTDHSSMHIMVTDINHHVRDLLKRELEKEGHSVITVGNSIEAFHRICDSTAVDLLILDPELLYPYGHSLFSCLLENNPSLRIIIHAYGEFFSGMRLGGKIHFVEKAGDSISALRHTIRNLSQAKGSD
jgi:DNA-binding NtrC family response regulator